jgi:hypothetical protein
MNANNRRNFLSRFVSSAAGLVVATAGGLSANAADGSVGAVVVRGVWGFRTECRKEKARMVASAQYC